MFFVDFKDPSLPRTLKTGTHYYRDFIKEYFNPHDELDKLKKYLIDMKKKTSSINE